MKEITLGVLLLISTAAARAQTQDICVGNLAQLEEAIALATSPLAQSFADKFVIRVQQGVYDLSNSPVLSVNDGFQRLYFDVETELLGGYGAACSSRTLDANNTRLWNSNPSLAMVWWPLADFKIEGFHFENFRNQIDFNGFTVNPVTQQNIFSHLRFSNGTGEIRMGAEAGGSGSLLELRNLEVWNRSLANPSDCAVHITADGQADANVLMHIINSTIANTQTGNGICIANIDTPRVFNSIFYGNTGFDFVRESGSSNGALQAYHNVFGTSAIGSYAVNSNNISSNPLFVDAPAGNLRLSPGSPALNSGFIAVPYGPGAVDVVGNTRVQGLAIDRGAYESNDTGLFLLSVTNTNDSGAGSLREVISQANATPGPNGITFNIGGSGCPKVITINSALPNISESLVVDASTQPGYIANSSSFGYNGTRCVVLQAALGPTPINWGLGVFSPATAGTRLVVDSMAFGGFSIAGVALGAGSNHAIVGSQFGGNVGSHAMIANGRGVFVINVPDVLIGGSPLNDRNTIGGSLGPGIEVAGATATGVQVVNNWIGFDGSGAGYGNDVGIRIAADGGDYKDNLVSYSVQEGFALTSNADDNFLYANRVGFPTLCLLPPCSAAANNLGMLVEGSFNRIAKNGVSNNGAGGIRVIGNDNALTENSVYLNGTTFVPPVDIGDAGFSPWRNNNEVNPPAGNRSVNYPALDSITQSPTQLVVNGTLTGKNGKYRVQLFGGSRRLGLVGSRCEGRSFIKTAVVNITNAPVGENGSASFTIGVDYADLPSASLSLLTATAIIETTLNGIPRFGDSSEYGNCVERPLFASGFE